MQELKRELREGGFQGGHFPFSPGYVLRASQRRSCTSLSRTVMITIRLLGNRLFSDGT